MKLSDFWPGTAAGGHRHRRRRHGVVHDRRGRVRAHAGVGARLRRDHQVRDHRGRGALAARHRRHAHRGLARGAADARRSPRSSSTSSSGATSSRARSSPPARWCRPRSCPSVPLPVWGFIHAVAAVAMVWFGRYERFLAVIKWFVGLKFVAIIASVAADRRRGPAPTGRGFGARSPFSVAYTLSLIGGVGGTVTLLSYAYWMREAGWTGPARVPAARTDLTMSFVAGLHLLLLDDLPVHADRLDRADPRRRAAAVPAAGRSHRPRDRPDRARGVPARILGRRVLVGARRLPRRAVPVRRHAARVAAPAGAAGSRAPPIARGRSIWARPRSRRSWCGGRCGWCSPTPWSGRCSSRS